MTTNRDNLNPFFRMMEMLTREPERSSFRVEAKVLANACAYFEQALKTIDDLEEQLKETEEEENEEDNTNDTAG